MGISGDRTARAAKSIQVVSGILDEGGQLPLEATGSEAPKESPESRSMTW